MGATTNGALTGATTGAALGTAVMPGVGTAVGGLGGAMLGAGIGGMFSGDEKVRGADGYHFDWSKYDDAWQQQNQARLQQNQIAEMLRMRAEGQGPSVAQSQLEQSTQANQAQAMALANSARGGVMQQAAARRQAIQQGAIAQQQSASQAAGLRAQEMAAAQGAYAQNASAMRQGDQNAMASQVSAQGTMANASNATAQTNAAIAGGNAERAANKNSSLMSMGKSMLGGLLSDRRMKENVHDADDDMRRFLDALRPYQFEYKGQPGTHYGVMAQDAERSPVGDSFVENGPGGVKTLDPNQGFGAVLAALANLNKRLEGVERNG